MIAITVMSGRRPLATACSVLAAAGVVYRVPNIMKRTMRCLDFGSGREASRSPYLEYWQGERQSNGPKLVPAPRLSLEIQMPAPGLRPKSATRRTVEQGPRLRGCDREGACEDRAIRRSNVPLRGRIQAHNAWNLLRPARDTLSAGLAISTYGLHRPSRHRQFWLATHVCFIMLGALRRRVVVSAVRCLLCCQENFSAARWR